MLKALEIHNLHVSVDEKEILHGVNLTIRPGEIHALMGPNGSGKSTLAHALMGHPCFCVTQGKIVLNGDDITQAAPEMRARAGVFLAFQHPREVQGVPLAQFLHEAHIARFSEKISIAQLRAFMRSILKDLALDDAFLDRPLNEGFSGGEKKKAEILQMMILKPTYAILDETDSGLDIDALKTVTAGIMHALSGEMAVVIITHYQRILQFIEPHFVHVMVQGKIVQSGSKELARELEQKGFKHFFHV
ncbi:MAG: Fe-S cluster assembly ATPase SufC [Patescibacteria group bacterium]